MRKVLVILLLLLSITVDARIRWVTPRGNDANTGADSSSTGAWVTWGKAFQTAIAGDTVYIRGGVYYVTASGQYGDITNDGTEGSYINFWAYPNDWDNGNYPILDFGRYVAPDWTWAIDCYHDNYLYFKGLTIRNLVQNPSGGYVQGIEIEESHHVILENLNVHHIGGPCISSHGSDEVYIKNTDTWESCDSLATSPGQNGTGIGVGTRRSYIYAGDPYDFHVYIEGCRAWNCSDQGFAQSGVGHHEWKNCWSFNNGRLEGEGWGMKLTISTESDTINPLSRVVKNCIFAVNASSGIDPNNLGGSNFNGHYFNNFFYHHGYKPETPYYANEYIGCAIWIPNYIGYSPAPNEMYANNLSYDNDKGDVVAHDAYTHQYNSWDHPNGLIITNEDFLSLDWTEMLRPRKLDWSLPDISFGKLAPGSDLIDAGRDSIITRDYAIALDYFGDAPDLGWYEYSPGPQIIADHSIVDDYEYIPQYYIDSVKKMWLSYAGESHSQAIRSGLTALETADATYAVNVTESGTPETYTDDYLRVSRATWGDYGNASGWIYGYGEEDWFTSAQAISRTKAGLTYATNNGFDLSVLGFGWCWDPAIDSPSEFLTYIEATKDYVDYVADSIPTKVIFTTGTTDIYDGETGYNKYLGYEQIRDSVLADTTRILFDYADILAYDDDGGSTTTTWGAYTYPWITPTNLSPEAYSSHISAAGALRLAKAMWWMLARIAGWDGNVTVYSEPEEPQIDSTLTNIITFTLPTQTGSATINTTNHTVAIEVNYLATVTNLTPYISLSYGATISPTSMTSRDFTTPQTYTVTALDGITTQNWTVTVTQEEEPVDPAGDSRIVKYRGLILKL